MLISCAAASQSPNPSRASIRDTDYDSPQTTEEYGIEIFELFAWLGTHDAR